MQTAILKLFYKYGCVSEQLQLLRLLEKTYEYLYRCEAGIQQLLKHYLHMGCMEVKGEHNLDRLRPGCVTRAHQRPTASPFTVRMHFGCTQRVIW